MIQDVLRGQPCDHVLHLSETLPYTTIASIAELYWMQDGILPSIGIV
ncbi:MAG: hypothetical protein MUO26_06875 [Methanotrichaceae archaeon]|nr:hypothetical protein [Methanotrichaceae archaeon]